MEKVQKTGRQDTARAQQGAGAEPNGQAQQGAGAEPNGQAQHDAARAQGAGAATGGQEQPEQAQAQAPVKAEAAPQVDVRTCLEKLRLVGTLAFATVDEDGAPQIRNVSAIHYDDGSFYFFTARGKEFSRQLQRDGRIQALGLTRFGEMIRLSGTAEPVPEGEQARCIDVIFEEQPLMYNVYPGDTRGIGIIYRVERFSIEYFNLGVHPIYRAVLESGGGAPIRKGYCITDACIGCGTCQAHCPQQCIREGEPFRIEAEHCLHCGACLEHCPAGAVETL